METGMMPSLELCIDRAFGLEEKNWSQYSPLSLAYLGDTVFDMVVRTVLVKRSRVRAGRLHHEASHIVCAGHQARMGTYLRQFLTEEEEAVYRRGRNAKPGHTARNSTREEYLEATAFETLLGYLYLMRRYERITQLVRLGMDELDRVPEKQSRRPDGPDRGPEKQSM